MSGASHCPHNRPIGSHCTPCRAVRREPSDELLAARKVVEAAREYRDECDQKCACVFTARLLAALDEADKAVGR